MVTRKMLQINYELKKNIAQRFEAQSEMIKSVVHNICALLIKNFKTILK